MSVTYPGNDAWVQLEQGAITPPLPATPILDNFNRADENPLSKGGMWVSGGSPLRLVSNQAATQPGVRSFSYWNEEFSANQEIYATLTSAITSGAGIDLSVRQSGAAGDHFGYDAWIYDSGYGIEKVVHDIWTIIVDVATPSTIVPGDVICFRAEGNVLTLLVNGVALVSIADDDVRDSGKIALELNGITADNCGGGPTGPAWAQLQRGVAAPPGATNAPLDDFNRANGPLGPNWLSPLLASGGAPLDDSVISGNRLYDATPGAMGYTGALWVAQTFPANQEVYATPAVTLGTDGWCDFYFWLRYIDNNNYYVCDFMLPPHTIGIYKNVAGVRTTIVEFPSPGYSVGAKLNTFVVGNEIRMSIDGRMVASATDSTFSGPGKIGFGFSGYQGQAADDFGGGQVSSAWVELEQ